MTTRTSKGTAKKKVTARKGGARKKASKRTTEIATPARAAKKKAPARSAAVRPGPKAGRHSSPQAPPKPAPTPTDPVATPGPSVSAQQVNLGHIFALRPRVRTGFSPEAFRDAARALADEKYPTLQDAARAVAEKAIELSNAAPGREPFQRR
jgi:hypothetical protein